VLTEDERFVHLTKPLEGWVLVDGPTTLWQGDLEELARAARTVLGVRIERRNTAGRTPQPVKVALQAVSAVVLRRANGSVRDQDLANLLRGRFVYIAPLVSRV